MATFAFTAGLNVESDTKQHNVTSPPAAKTHSRGPSLKELDEIELPDTGGYFIKARQEHCSAAITPAGRQTPTPALTGYQSPKTPNDLEASPPPTPQQHREAANIVPSWSYPAMNKWRVLAACLIYLGNGMNDSAPGALIPYMETYYHIGYAIVSLIWITNAVGFIAAAFCTDILREKLGRAKTLMLSELIMTAGYIMTVCTPPFAVVVVAYFLIGFGYALNLALNNVFSANLANSTVILGAAHGSYGIGGILGPIVATALVSGGVL